jgi:chemotaxis protein CheD
MHIKFDPKYSLEVVEIFPGEFHATRSPRIISTVLGSCVSVALSDPAEGVAGMNHFMLPGELGGERIYTSGSGKYGMYAMELLINEMIKLGGKKRAFVAKVFGGGKVLKSLAGGTGSVSEHNVTFALKYLEEENIPISSSDVGGFSGRRILFFTGDSRVLLKRLTPSEEQPVEKEELDYFAQLRKRTEKKEDVTLF